MTEGLTGKAEAVEEEEVDGTLMFEEGSFPPEAPRAALVLMETVRWPRV